MSSIFFFLEPPYSIELYDIIKLSIPTLIGYFLQFLLNVTAIIYVGHLEPSTLLASAGLAVLYANITGYSIVFGLATCMDTLCSQAYGAAQYELVGKISQRTSVFLLIMCVPSIILWMFCSKILINLGQNVEIAELSGQYLIYMIPGFLGAIQLEVLKKYLSSQKVMHLFPSAMLFANLLQILLCYLFIFVFNFGFVGAPIATSCSFIFADILLLFFIVRGNYHEKTWTGFLPISELFTGWGSLIKLGVPGMAMLCLEWWCFEICALLTGLIDVVSLQAFVIAQNLNALAFMLPLGVSISASAVIGNHLGAKKPELARIAAYCAITVNLLVISFNASTSYLARNWLGYLFSSDEAAIEKFASVQPVVSGMQFFDGFQCVAAGVLRGCGLQKIGAALNLFTYYFLCLPAAYLFAFKLELGVIGIWVGLGVGVCFSSIIFITYILNIDWNEQSRLAAERNSEHQDVSNFAFINETLEDISREEGVGFTPIFVVDDHDDIDEEQISIEMTDNKITDLP